jgi:hypothetical protein
MKRRDKRIQYGEGAFEDKWQMIKESVRQLKQDHERNILWKTLRAAYREANNPSRSPAVDNDAASTPIIPNGDDNGNSDSLSQF